MTIIHAAQTLTPQGWRRNVRLHVRNGRIAAIQTDVAPQAGDDLHAVLVPAMANLHSHAFQRGMAGLTELRGSCEDNFWSWREVMYRFALSMTPEQVEAIAGQVYMEMLEAGFGRVGEFHYLHHHRDGRPYADPGEMAGRIAAAAQLTGIGLTLLPVFYAHSTFGGAAPSPSQRRFISTIDSYGRLLERCHAVVQPLATAVVGAAPHSLRAVTPQELAEVTALAATGPIHIHIAEQRQEVEDCLAWSGQRPVQWLLDHAALDTRWCLVHATHMDATETARLAATGAIAGLCPITEANLGDGTFDALDFIRCGGRFGIGTDSNVQVGVADELRLLEYSQRLLHRARNVLGTPERSTGRVLLERALPGGAMALGAGFTGIAVDCPADFVSLDRQHPALACKREDALLDAWIFSGGNSVIDCVWVAGEKVVSAGRHRRRDEIVKRFFRTMQQLCD